jgi:hypothetical protein
MLDRVDDVATGRERLGTMRRTCADPDREFADGEVADAVHAGRARDAERFDRLGHDAFAFAFGQRLNASYSRCRTLRPSLWSRTQPSNVA